MVLLSSTRPPAHCTCICLPERKPPGCCESTLHLLKPGGLCTAAGNGGGVFIVRLEPGVGALPGGARGRGEACSGRGRGEGRRTAGAARCSAAAVLPPAWFGGD